jgi:NitT/TauT family transport system permease protein
MKLRRSPRDVLVVDDDRTLDLENHLAAAGLHPIRLYDCQSALAYVRAAAAGAHPSLLAAIVNMALPLAPAEPAPQLLAGLKLLEQLRTIHPTLKLVPMSGSGWGQDQVPGYEILQRCGDYHIAGWITKPASAAGVERLARALRPRSLRSTLLRFKRPLSRRRRLQLGTMAFLFLVVLWWLLAERGMIDPIFLPSPARVVPALVHLVVNEDLLSDIGASVFRVMMAFSLASAVAIPLGILMGSFAVVEALVSPFCAFVRYMPPPAFIPLIILWLGIGHSQKIAVIFLGVFFYLLVLIAAAVAEVPSEYIDTAYTLGASRKQVLFRVVSPAALPGILESLRAMIGAAWTYLIAAELVAAQRGIGYRIIKAQRFLQTDVVIAAIIVIGIIGLLTDFGFRALIRLVSPWKG